MEVRPSSDPRNYRAYGMVHYNYSMNKGTRINKQITLDSFTILFLFITIFQTFFKKKHGDENKRPVYWYLPAYKMTPLPHSINLQFS